MKASVAWPLAIVSLLALNVLVVAVTVVSANSDPSSSIESNYYEKAVHWDQTAAEAAQSARLGWTCKIRLVGAQSASNPGALDIVLADRNGAPVDGAVVHAEIFHNARAADRTELALSPLASGAYSGAVTAMRPGLWHVNLVVDRAGDRFVLSSDCELLAATPEQPGGRS